MELHYGLSIIAGVAPAAYIETIDTYKSNMEFYDKNRFTYIPMPLDELYYDRDNDEVRELSSGQFIYEDETTRAALDKLVNNPFLLVEHRAKISIKPSAQFVFSYKISEDEGQVVGDIHDAYQEFPERADELVEMAAEYPIFRIFTLADVNRRTVKQSLYGAIAEVESRLAQEINKSNLEAEELYGDLSAETIGRWEKAKLSDVNIPISEFMNLSEMLKIVGKRNELRQEFGFSSRNQFDNELGGLIELRNSIMHASRSLVHNRSDLEKLTERIGRAESVIEAHGGEVKRSHYE